MIEEIKIVVAHDIVDTITRALRKEQDHELRRAMGFRTLKDETCAILGCLARANDLQSVLDQLRQADSPPKEHT